MIGELDAATAQQWFDAMPQGQRVLTLSPCFAQADAARRTDLRCVHVGVERGAQRWLHSVHLQPVAGFGWGAISPYGYGGPLANDADAGFLAAAWSAWSAWARAHRVIGEFARFHPEAGEQHRFFGGEVQFNRMTISVDLLREDVASQYNQLARRKLRRAQGVPVRWSTEPADWRAWGAFYRRAMAAMQAAPRFHFGDDYFAALATVPGVALCICGDDGAWLSAGVYLFQHRAPHEPAGGTVEYHLGASSPEGHARGTAYLLQHAAALEGRRRQLGQLYLGAGTSTAGDDPLLFYKRCFSRRERAFHIGRAVHDAELFAACARARGYDPQSAPANLLFD